MRAFIAMRCCCTCFWFWCRTATGFLITAMTGSVPCCASVRTRTLRRGTDLIRKDLIAFDGRVFQVLSLPDQPVGRSRAVENRGRYVSKRSRYGASNRRQSLRSVKMKHTEIQEIEIGLIELRYEHTRIHNPQRVASLAKGHGALRADHPCNHCQGKSCDVCPHRRISQSRGDEGSAEETP